MINKLSIKEISKQQIVDKNYKKKIDSKELMDDTDLTTLKLC